MLMACQVNRNAKKQTALMKHEAVPDQHGWGRSSLLRLRCAVRDDGLLLECLVEGLGCCLMEGLHGLGSYCLLRDMSLTPYIF